MLTIADGGGRGGVGTPVFGWRNLWTAPYQLVSSWCSHQPESHQLSLNKRCQSVRDRTPRTPEWGSPIKIGVGPGFASHGSKDFFIKYCFPNLYWWDGASRAENYFLLPNSLQDSIHNSSDVLKTQRVWYLNSFDVAPPRKGSGVGPCEYFSLFTFFPFLTNGNKIQNYSECVRK